MLTGFLQAADVLFDGWLHVGDMTGWAGSACVHLPYFCVLHLPARQAPHPLPSDNTGLWLGRAESLPVPPDVGILASRATRPPPRKLNTVP